MFEVFQIDKTTFINPTDFCFNWERGRFSKIGETEQKGDLPTNCVLRNERGFFYAQDILGEWYQLTQQCDRCGRQTTNKVYEYNLICDDCEFACYLKNLPH